MKNRIFALAAMFAIAFGINHSFTIIRAQTISPSDYFWENSIEPDNKYEIYSFAKQWTTRPGFVSKDFRSTYARAYKSQKDENELMIIIPYLPFNGSWDKKYKDFDFIENFVLRKNPEENDEFWQTIIYPRRNDITLVSGKTYTISNSSSANTDLIIEDDLSPYFDEYEIENLFYLDSRIYNVIAVITFSDNEYDNPTSLRFIFDKEPKVKLIGTLAQTSAEYKDKGGDNYGGWQTWVELKDESDKENPDQYTYTFVAEDTEYDFILNIPFTVPQEYRNEKEVVKYYDSESSFFWDGDYTTEKWIVKSSGPLEIGKTKYYASANVPKEPGANSTLPDKPIHLKGLTPGKVYQIRVNGLSYHTLNAFYDVYNYVDQSVELCEAQHVFAWISLTEYTPQLVAYQLIEHTAEQLNGNQVYYTYDYNGTDRTFKVAVDEQDNVVYCAPDSLDEQTAFLHDEYLFSDKLLILAEDPEWKTNTGIDVKISSFNGNLKFKNQEYSINENFGDNESEIKFAKVISFKDETTPLSLQDFKLNEGYSYSYINNFDISIDGLSSGDFETFDNWGRTETRGYYEEKLEGFSGVTKTLVIGDETGLLNPPVETTGQLVVPTPRPLGEKHILVADRAVESNQPADSTVYVRFYDDELRGSEDFLEMAYKLPKLSIHAHDYDVTFPYDSANVTADMYALLHADESAPMLRFRFFEDGMPTDVYADGGTTPGFYNAHLGDIYDAVVNQGQPAVSSTIGIRVSDNEGNDLSIDDYMSKGAYPVFKRWESDMTATVELDLNAPRALVPVTNDTKQETQLIRALRPAKDAEGKVEEVIYVTGIGIENTTDTITGGPLSTGDNSNDTTALYLLEIAGVDGYILTTKEEIAGMEFIVAVGSTAFDAADWEDNRMELKDVFPDGEKNIFSLRNVYLFPKDKDGLTFAETTPTVAEGVAMRAALPSDGIENPAIYHAVTTPPTEVKVYASDDRYVLSGIEDIDFESSASLVRVDAGSVEVLVDGCTVYNVSGIAVATGRGIHRLAGGVYIAVSGRRMQKFVIFAD